MIFTQELKREIFARDGKRTIVSNAVIVERSTKKPNLQVVKPTPVGGSSKEQNTKQPM